ncbi:hypothetical protein ACIVBQ_000556 [Tenacibaculum discolor]
MELLGRVQDKLITKDQTFTVEKSRGLFFKNLGGATVMIGIFPLKPYESISYSSDSVTIDKQDIPISFLKDSGAETKLYVQYTKVTGFNCD